MQTAATIARQWGAAVLFVLQTALFERDPLTNVERQLLDASLPPCKSKEALIESYARLRAGLSLIADDKNVLFLDCSRVFNRESATTFTDMWHFSDAGHQILATALVPSMKRVLLNSAGRSSSTP